MQVYTKALINHMPMFQQKAACLSIRRVAWKQNQTKENIYHQQLLLWKHGIT